MLNKKMDVRTTERQEPRQRTFTGEAKDGEPTLTCKDVDIAAVLAGLDGWTLTEHASPGSDLPPYTNKIVLGWEFKREFKDEPTAKMVIKEEIGDVLSVKFYRDDSDKNSSWRISDVHEITVTPWANKFIIHFKGNRGRASLANDGTRYVLETRDDEVHGGTLRVVDHL